MAPWAAQPVGYQRLTAQKIKRQKNFTFFLAISRKVAYCISMITIKQNPNFTKFFQVFAFGQYVDEVERRGKAVRIATKLAKEHKQEFINVDGEMRKV